MNKTNEALPKRPSTEPGDAIYYKHPDTGHPHIGYVAATGKTGMLVDADGGGEHKVKWADYIAHKARAERKLTIVDRGEDGSICKDETGRLVFVHGEIPSAEGLTKALPGSYETAIEARIADALAQVLSAISRAQLQHQQSLDRLFTLFNATQRENV